MDLSKTGKFIAERRKLKGLTQVKLAQILNVSEKTVSKWECGNGFPDTSLILPLCNALNISANELLSGKVLSNEEYKENAEQNLITLKSAQEKSAKHLLALELVIGYMSTISFFIMIFTASYFVSNIACRIVLICVGIINVIIGILFAIKIEKEAGFYECGCCHYKYIPSYKSVLWSMHYGRTRYMRCPKCGKKSWNKKTINND